MRKAQIMNMENLELEAKRAKILREFTFRGDAIWWGVADEIISLREKLEKSRERIEELEDERRQK